MNVATFTKTGSKATVGVKLDKSIFGLEVKNHELLQQAYLAYLANGRTAGAKTKKRGEVRGGGVKPWRQKGTGRARVGSIRSPIWRGGGITFGPTGDQNYTHSISTEAKRRAIRQALSLAVNSNKVNVIETFNGSDGKVSKTNNLLKKMGLDNNTLVVVSQKSDLIERATSNLQNIKVVQANYINVYDVLNADHILLSQKSLEIINSWLGVDKV